jgi:hypothetical protein
MTWQRIDENTYIDDTLVTCAEYQLFIDEMREQGKYYQPDHWTSYRFPEGQAREPILGIRLGDAKEFCRWLTENHENSWIFRNPALSEIENIVSSPDYPRIGYWSNEGGLLSRATSEPLPNFRQISNQYVNTITRAFTEIDEGISDSLKNTSIAGQMLKQLIRKRGLGNPLEDATTYTCIPLDIGNYVAFEQALTNAIGFGVELENFRTNTNSHKIISKFDLDHAISRAKMFVADDSHVLYKASMSVIEEYLQRPSREIHFHGKNEQALFGEAIKALEQNLVRRQLIYFSVDLYTLSERIAGRSPAFEGIRLVKERK